MTNQKAIALLEEIRPKKCKMVGGRLRGGYPDHDSDIGKAIDLAIEALEKQIPKKPIYVGNTDIFDYACPTCGQLVYELFDFYCSQCGQKLTDWSEVE